MLLVAAVALVLFLKEALLLAARRGSARELPRCVQSALLLTLQAAIFVSFCVLPSVTRTLFLAFQCESCLPS